MAPEILPGIDSEIAALLRADYTKKGITFHLNAQVKEVSNEHVLFATSEGIQSIDTTQILLCVGRQPNLESLGLESLQLERFRRGIAVNDHMQTSHPHIYAIGDITGFSMLAHTASREAEVAINHLVGIEDGMNYNVVPAVAYTNPEVAGVGVTEDALQAKGINYLVAKLPMTFSGRFVAENEGGNGLCKLIFNEEQQLLGAHIIGNPASELIATATLAMERGLTVSEFKKLIFPHPSVGEIFKETLFTL
jgi:dihydrolipoamide dehydrogenase